MILVKLDRWLVSQVAGQPAGARQQNTARRLAALRWLPDHLFSRVLWPLGLIFTSHFQHRTEPRRASSPCTDF